MGRLFEKCTHIIKTQMLLITKDADQMNTGATSILHSNYQNYAIKTKKYIFKSKIYVRSIPWFVIICSRC